MGKELTIKATREITINKTGNIEIQSYFIYPNSFNLDICKLIINSNNPYEEWCNKIRHQYNLNIPIYIWDLEENYGVPEIMQKEEYFYNKNGADPELNKEDIVGYKNLGDDFIAELDIEIKEALHNSYDLKWIIS